MNYEELNHHLRERIRERVGRHLAEPGVRDYIVGVIIMIADQNSLEKAAARLVELKQANPATACTYEEAFLTVAKVLERFETEVSILHDLYQMQEANEDSAEIIAHLELRLTED